MSGRRLPRSNGRCLVADAIDGRWRVEEGFKRGNQVGE
jgi:hypothetical protein